MNQIQRSVGEPDPLRAHAADGDMIEEPAPNSAPAGVLVQCSRATPGSTMPRYYFHTHVGEDVVLDPDGRELADLEAVREAARELALQLLQGDDSDPDLHKAVLYVSDEAKEFVLEYALSEALGALPGGDTMH